MMAGDPSGLPASFPIILFFVGLLTAFIFLFAQLWQTYAFAYAHGAILTRELRRAEEKKAAREEKARKLLKAGEKEMLPQESFLSEDVMKNN